jgi:hypothetical protein
MADDLTSLPPSARAFVEEDAALLPTALSAEEGQQLVDVLLARGDAARLVRLGEGAGVAKPLAKAARRALHVLRTRGVSTPAPAPRTFQMRGPYAEEEAVPSLATTYDQLGERRVLFAQLGPDRSTIEVHSATLSETHGLIGYELTEATRKQWRGLVADAPETQLVWELPSAYARWLIEEAYLQTVAMGRAVPERFAEARLLLPPTERPAEHPALAAAPPYDELPADARARSLALFELPPLGAWLPPEELSRKLELALSEIATSQLVVDPAGRMAQAAGAIERLIAETYGGEAGRGERERLAQRLDETALLFARAHLEAARLMTTLARRLRALSDGVLLAEEPFLRALVERGAAPSGTAVRPTSP